MNKVNRKLEYSLMALKHIAGKPTGQLTTAKEISENFKAPFDATARVLQSMAQRGLLKAEHGAHGGYLLVQDLSQVNMNDLIEIVQGPIRVSKCLHEDDPCEIRDSCNIVTPIQNFNDQLTDFFKSISVKDLLFQKANGDDQRT